MSATTFVRRASLYPTPEPPLRNTMEDSDDEESASPDGSVPSVEGHVGSAQAATPPASPQTTERLREAAYQHLLTLNEDELRKVLPSQPSLARTLPDPGAIASSPETHHPSPPQTVHAVRRQQPHPVRAESGQAPQTGAVRRSTVHERQSPYIIPLRGRAKDGTVRMAAPQQEEIVWVDIREARSAIRKLDDVFSLGHSEVALAAATSIVQTKRIDPVYVQVMPPPMGGHQANQQANHTAHPAEAPQRVQMAIQPRVAGGSPRPAAGVPISAPQPFAYHSGPPPFQVQPTPTRPAYHPPVQPVLHASQAGRAPSQTVQIPTATSPPTLSDRRGRPPPPAIHVPGTNHNAL